MDVFWEWFQRKTGFGSFTWMNHNRENHKLNLIGHMIEFCIENFIEFEIKRGLKTELLSSIEEVDNIYSYLERKINELEKQREEK